MNTSSQSVHNLLSNLKSIVELVLKFPGDSLTSQYGAIERIRAPILSIFSHGLKQSLPVSTEFDSTDQLNQLCCFIVAEIQKSFYVATISQTTGESFEQLWQLIIRLNSNSQKYIRLLQDIYHKENLRLTVEQWIEQSVITQCLSQQMSCIEKDMKMLDQYYYSKNRIDDWDIFFLLFSAE
ncbi:unnamed protein product [Adineta ricciae]|uniref:RUN domain-containing protein n=1 Tax=Adineta ricciae TaxID=249248 RepID=A0A815IPH5_ADIRI|nr:unnamed protein product [Adineta ricciae]